MPSSIDEPDGSTPRKRSKYAKRACQHCQRRKIKCDGNEPCEHCASIKETCVYMPGKARGGARVRTAGMEGDTNTGTQPPGSAQAEGSTMPSPATFQTSPPLLRTPLQPNISATSFPVPLAATSHPHATLHDRVGWLEENVLRLNAAAMQRDELISASQPTATSNPSMRLHRPNEAPAHLARRVRGERQSIRSGDDSGGRSSERRAADTVYYGNSSVVGNIHTLRDKLCSLAPASSRTEAELFVGEQEADTPTTERRNRKRVLSPLPSRQVSYTILAHLFNDLMSMYPLLHAPTFYDRYACLWDTDGNFQLETAQSDAFTDMEVSLIYAGMAAAVVLTRAKPQQDDRPTTDPTVEAGKWYRTAKRLLDANFEQPTELEQIQTLCMLLLYFFNIDNEDASYKLTGLAVRGAYEMGLHLSKLEAGHAPVTIELRRRAWWCLYLLDRRTSVSLGRPAAIQDSDVNVEYPNPLDDSVSFPDQLERPLRIDQSKIPYLVEFVKFSCILGSMYEQIYGVQAKWPPTEETVLQLDKKLEEWRFELPAFLRYSPERLSTTPNWLGKQQLFLHLRGAHVRLLLLRPFVSDTSDGTHGEPPLPGSMPYRMAERGIGLSSEIIHTIAQVKRSSDLIDILWYPARQFLLTTVTYIFSCVLNFGGEPKFSAAAFKADVRVALELLKEFSYKSSGSQRNLRDVEFLRYMCSQALQSKRQAAQADTKQGYQANTLPPSQQQMSLLQQSHLPLLPVGQATDAHYNQSDLHYSSAMVPQHYGQPLPFPAAHLQQEIKPLDQDLAFLNPFTAMGGDSSDLLMSVLDSGDKEFLPATTEFGDLSVAFY